MAHIDEHPNSKDELSNQHNIVQQTVEQINSVKDVLQQLGFNDEAITREQMKVFAERMGNALFMSKLLALPDKEFIKHYLAFLKVVYPVQKAEDSRQKSLQIVIQNSNSTEQPKVLPTPSVLDLPSFNFDNLQSPLDSSNP